MNRAPVALFALLCTLASSMVAAGVANDRPAAVVQPIARTSERSNLKTVSFASSPLEKWQTDPGYPAIDIRRAVALPTKKIPTRIPAEVKPVTAIIITVEQAPVAAAKTPAKSATTVATKPAAAKPASAVAAKPTVKVQKLDVHGAAAAVNSVVSKMVAAAKSAPTQPRVSSSYSKPTAVNSTTRGVLSMNVVTLADLHLWKPAVATTTGKVVTLPTAPVAQKADNVAKVTLGEGKLQIAYGSLNMLSVGGTSFTASPYIADNASSILLNKGTSKVEVKSTAKTRSTDRGFSIWTWGGSELHRLHVGLARTIDAFGRQAGRRVNQAADGYLGQVQMFTAAYWFPMLNTGDDRGIIKTVEKPSVTK